MKPILVYITTQNKSEASLISKKLLAAKACACTNIIENMISFFVWNKVNQSSEEAVLLVKTFDLKFKDVCRIVKENHSYENPAILSLPIQDVEPQYLDWMKSNLDI